MSRLQINPQPLRRVKRKELASLHELADRFRCKETTQQGHRCVRLQTSESDYCWQHQ